MTYKELCNLKEAANEQLAMAGKPYQLNFMSQNQNHRITINLASPEQAKKDTAKRTLVSYLSVNQAALWMQGWQAYAAMERTYLKPVDQVINAALYSVISPDMAQELLNNRETARQDRLEALRLIDYGKGGNSLTDMELILIGRIFNVTITEAREIVGQ